MKNITFSADEHLIQLAREKAQKNKKSLNVLFRKWLANYVKDAASVEDYVQIMKKLDYVDVGRRFSREEMNER